MNKILKISIVLLFCNLACKDAKKVEAPAESKTEANLIKFSKKQFVNLPISLGGLEQISMDDEIAANGVVDVPPDKVFMVSYPINGFISKIGHNLLPGKFVKKGELLATIQSMELLQLQEDFVNESTKNEWLTQEFIRQKNLLNEDATAKRKLQDSENQLKINQLKIRALAEKLKMIGYNPQSLTVNKITPYHNIYAQNNAYIKSVNVANGKSFMPADVLFELINTDHMHVELKVFGNDANSIKLGQTVNFLDQQNNKVGAKVYLIDKTIDPQTKSLNIHVHIDNEAFEQTLRPGQYISGKIKAKSKTVMGLKESAILSTSDGKFVYLLTGASSFKKVEVKTGTISGGYVEILNPENIKGKIVIKGANFVDNGQSGDEE